MSDMDDAYDARSRAAARATRTRASQLALGAAAGSAVGAAALASVSGTLPAFGSDTPVAWASAAVLGAAAGLLLAARPATGTPAAPVGPSAPDADAEVSTAWLHVVSGLSRTLLEAALSELSARSLARGERVLVVDGSRHLALHDWFGADARLGLVECLAGTLPLLGVVQSGGRSGLYLLAHGAPATEERWSRLGQLLEEAWPHFGRVLLVVDAAAHEPVGDALRGRMLMAWWAGSPGALPRSAQALAQRLGICFSRIDLGTRANATLEALDARVAELAARLPSPPPEPAALPPAPAAAVAVPSEVLACNLQVRERLRFLIWMRRLQAESQRAALVPALQG